MRSSSHEWTFTGELSLSQAQGNYVKPRLLAVVLTLCGIGLSFQGWTLASLGGSPYYLAAGLLLVAVALLLFR
ncbi:MAG: hypothetical protein ACPF89_11055, partial [Pseudohongiellaceae bacterium]